MTTERQLLAFEVLGSFRGRGSAPARLVGPGPDGSERFYVNYCYPECTDLVAYHQDGDTFDVWTSSEGSAQAMAVSPQGNLYLGTFHQGRVLKLDVQAGVLIDLGQAMHGDTFIWSYTVGTDGLIYGGTSSNAHLFSIDPTTDLITDLGRVDEQECFLRELCAGPDGWIYGAVGCGRMDFIAYHPPTETLCHLLPKALRTEGFPGLFLGCDGQVYGTCHGTTYLLEKGELLPVPEAPPAMDRTCWTDGTRAAEAPDYMGNTMMLHRVSDGPDGCIYATSTHPEYLFQYDPANGACVNLGLIPGEEAFAFVNAYARLFIASYPESTVQIYDPAQPFNASVERAPSPPDAEHGCNPANYGSIAPHQQRPYDMALGADGNVYIASAAGYGYLQGVIAWYDPLTNCIDYVPNPLGEERLTALCPLPEGHLLVASALLGDGVTVAPTDARLFRWNLQSRAIIGDPVVPITGEAEIGNLILGGDGLLYGSACQQLFVFDPATMTVLTTGRSPSGDVCRAGMLTLADGRVIALCGPYATFLRYHNGTLNIEIFAECGKWPLVGKAEIDGYLYASSGVELIRVKIPNA
jgi:hypothetical protein